MPHTTARVYNEIDGIITSNASQGRNRIDSKKNSLGMNTKFLAELHYQEVSFLEKKGKTGRGLTLTQS
jgi:hypothetical protein